ncbi:MAG: anti-sigma factor [Phyllobacteriaceae bacterium]|jgi:anti-sigma factor RsiW|nr:anti-sigma factor [Phyllobacteriaceae bacterium]
MEQKFSDTALMAYADGELDAEERAEIARAVERDEALAARLAVFTRTRQAASDAFEPLLDAPVPDALASSIAQMVERHETAAASSATEAAADDKSNVIAFDRDARRTSAWRFDLAMAASIALVAGGVIGYLASGWGGASQPSGMVTANLDNPGLPAALRTVPSGEETELGSDRFRAIASFRDEAGHLCREFELDGADASTLVSVACQTDGQWRVRFTVAAAGADDGYAPASSLEALDAYLSAIGAGEPLSADDERAMLDRLP